MPINEAQKGLLNDFFSDDGIYTESIKDDTTINLGTKILYLKRAISNSCKSFFSYLDKLYNPNLIEQEKEKHLELIRALKVINDIYNNNWVKYDEFGLKKALDHYFSSLGSINQREFQIYIEEIISAKIHDLRCDQENTVKNQKIVRILTEFIIPQQTAWRVLLELPEEQLIKNNLFSEAIRTIKEVFHRIWHFLLGLITGKEPPINENITPLQAERTEETYENRRNVNRSGTVVTAQPIELPNLVSPYEGLQTQTADRAYNNRRNVNRRSGAVTARSIGLPNLVSPYEHLQTQTADRAYNNGRNINRREAVTLSNLSRREEEDTINIVSLLIMLLPAITVGIICSIKIYTEDESFSLPLSLRCMLAVFFIAMLKEAKKLLHPPFLQHSERIQENTENQEIETTVSRRFHRL